MDPPLQATRIRGFRLQFVAINNSEARLEDEAMFLESFTLKSGRGGGVLPVIYRTIRERTASALSNGPSPRRRMEGAVVKYADGNEGRSSPLSALHQRR